MKIVVIWKYTFVNAHKLGSAIVKPRGRRRLAGASRRRATIKSSASCLYIYYSTTHCARITILSFLWIRGLVSVIARTACAEGYTPLSPAAAAGPPQYDCWGMKTAAVDPLKPPDAPNITKTFILYFCHTLLIYNSLYRRHGTLTRARKSAFYQPHTLHPNIRTII